MTEITTTTRKALESIGGSYWEAGTLHRVYFNQEILLPLIGLELTFYKTGNISSATLNGAYISNGKARKMVDAVRYCKFWYDLNADSVFAKGNTSDLSELVLETLSAKIAAALTIA